MVYINKKILALCEERGWTLYRLATEACITPSTLTSCINRDTPPKIDTLESICEALGITLSQFFLNDEEYEVLSKKEKELITLYRALPEGKKNAFIDLLKN